MRRVRAAASGRGSHLVSFRRYARRYLAGAKLEVRVTKGGFIGAYTSFEVKRREIPRRLDTCLSASGRPAPCPT